MNNDANKYIEELTRVDSGGEIKITLAQAKNFVGVTEQRNETTGEVIKNEKDEIQYEFLTKEVIQDDGSTKTVKTNGHTILASASDYGIGTISGFDALVLKNNETGELSFNIRGTEFDFTVNSAQDLLSDYHLSILGFTAQEVSMNNFYNKLIEENIISNSDKLTLKSCIMHLW